MTFRDGQQCQPDADRPAVCPPELRLEQQYLFEGDVSHDGSSRFGPNNKYGTFPSASIAWRVSDESFFRATSGSSTTSSCVARGAASATIKSRLSVQQTININSGNYSFGNVLSSGATPGRIANPDIGWGEQPTAAWTSSSGAKLSFTGDVYNKQTPACSSRYRFDAGRSDSSDANGLGEQCRVGRRSIGGARSARSLRSDSTSPTTRTDHEPPRRRSDQRGLAPSIRRVGVPIDAYFGIKRSAFSRRGEVALGNAEREDGSRRSEVQGSERRRQDRRSIAW